MTNLEIIQELYRAFREKDYDAFSHLCTDDLEWIQNPGFPNGATYRGASAVIQAVFRVNDTTWEGFRYTIQTMLEAGDTVIVGACHLCDEQLCLVAGSGEPINPLR
jgi:uncharacterized protein